MAIVWKKEVNNTLYEVRSHGASIRLYTDGVFHSQYNDKLLFTGALWDILALPALLCPPDSVKSILVLGVGGGSVIQMLLEILNPNTVIGIEINPTHLYIAKRFFKLRDKRVKLVQADAVEWITNYRGPSYDLIIEDLYGESEGEPERVVKPNETWFNILSRNLTAKGMLVMNFVSKSELKGADYFNNEKIRNYFSSALQITTPSYENRVAVFVKGEASSRAIKTNLKTLSLPGRKIKNLNYNCRKL